MGCSSRCLVVMVIMAALMSETCSGAGLGSTPSIFCLKLQRSSGAVALAQETQTGWISRVMASVASYASNWGGQTTGNTGGEEAILCDEGGLGRSWEPNGENVHEASWVSAFSSSEAGSLWKLDHKEFTDLSGRFSCIAGRGRDCDDLLRVGYAFNDQRHGLGSIAL